MGRNMKKLMITAILLSTSFSLLPAFATIDTERLLNEDYLRNAGYSQAAIDMINVKRYDPYAPYENNKNKKNFLVRFWHYMDPASDSGTFGRGTAGPKLDRPSGLE